MDDGTLTNRWAGSSPRRATRRSVLKAGAGLAAGAAFAGRTGRARAQDGSAIAIPPPRTQLPANDVTLRWVDSGGIKGQFFEELFSLYREARPNITVAYDALPWPEIAQVVPLGVRNGNAHDVFQLPLNVEAAQAVAEGWVAPLDEVISDLEAWKAAFPPGVFLEGFTDFGGRTYTFPIHSTKRYASLLFYNAAYLEAAGYDPAAAPLTWDQFRDAARKITAAGAGEYYGLVLSGNQTTNFAADVGNLARMAGAAAGTFVANNYVDWRTGQFIFTADQVAAAIELLLTLRDDGSVFPGSLAINAEEMRAQFPNGIAGMMLQGPWNVPQYRREAPDFAFGLASQPVPNDGTPTPLTAGPGGDDFFWVFVDSPLKAVAGDILAYIGSEAGQIAYQTLTKSATGVIFPEANRVEGGDPLSLRALEIYDQQMRVGPDPRVRNPQTAAIYREFRSPEPDFGQVIQGIYVGQIEDIRGALRDLEGRVERELERAIGTAQAAGAEVGRDDFVFPNWDPTRDYTEADYAALG